MKLVLEVVLSELNYRPCAFLVIFVGWIAFKVLEELRYGSFHIVKRLLSGYARVVNRFVNYVD